MGDGYSVFYCHHCGDTQFKNHDPDCPTQVKKETMRMKNQLRVTSKITNEVPGLTENSDYEFLGFGFYRGPYCQIVNDRGEVMVIYDYSKYLDTSKVEGLPLTEIGVNSGPMMAAMRDAQSKGSK